jgi:hypothetical protein
LPVLTEPTVTSADTEGVPSLETVISPLKVPRVPRTRLTMRWRTEKLIDE